MPRKGKESCHAINPAEVMKETMRILEKCFFKQDGLTVKLDRGRLKSAPDRAFKYEDCIEAPKPATTRPCCIRLGEDCLDAAAALCAEHPESVPLVLDFASGSNPGGGLKGNQQGTQEEDICRRTSLLPSLERQSYPLPRLGGIYAPDICVFRGPGKIGYPLHRPFWISILAAELPNCGDDQKDQDFIARKVRGVLHMAIQQGHTSLVLGAWGCGAFGNDPMLVAQIFKAGLLRCGK